ncbi:MAG: glycosyltransferase 87 family protein [Myxococcota bacterium]
MLLHQAADRSEASIVVAIAILWGAVVVGLRRHLEAGSEWWLLGAALLVRLSFVGTPPLLSDDLYRYVFEGKALWAGHNPLTQAPQTLPGIDDELLALVNHPEVSTVYPPVALLWFRLLALFGTAWGVQLATALFDTLTVWGVRSATRHHWPAWIYALHPLVILEGAHAGHLDLVAVGFAVWGVAAFRHGRFAWAGTALVAGGGVKLLPFAFVLRPVLALRRRWIVILGWLLAGLAISGVYLEAGIDGLTGLRTYAREWSFNPLAFALVEPWLEEWTRPVLVAIGALVSLRALRHEDPARTWLEIGLAFVVLSPTVHPWYLLWAMVPGLLLEDPRGAAATLGYLPAYTILLSFDPATGQWTEAAWLPFLTWVPMLAIYLFTPAESTPRQSHSPPQTAAGTAATGSPLPK